MAKKKRTMSEAARQAASERMKAMHAAKKLQNQLTEEPISQNIRPELPERAETQIAGDPDINELKRQVQETNETIALLKAALLGQQNQSNRGNIQVSATGRLLGEVEKYLVDPSNYPDPTERLSQENRLKPLAFDFNYELEYEVAVSSYETKTGVNTKEPKFTVTLNKVVTDEQGQPTNKRYIARRMVFHEDPQAAIVIARDNGIQLDQTDEKAFLNEMRYLRIRDWLYDIFWPKPVQPEKQIREEVIGGTIVQVFTKNSVDPGKIDFDSLSTKVH